MTIRLYFTTKALNHRRSVKVAFYIWQSLLTVPHRIQDQTHHDFRRTCNLEIRWPKRMATYRKLGWWPAGGAGQSYRPTIFFFVSQRCPWSYLSLHWRQQDCLNFSPWRLRTHHFKMLHDKRAHHQVMEFSTGGIGPKYFCTLNL